MNKQDFDLQFLDYKEYMQEQIMKVAEYDTHQSYQLGNPEDLMGVADFFRYKAGMVLTEKQFWNGIVSAAKIKNDVTKKALAGMH